MTIRDISTYPTNGRIATTFTPISVSVRRLTQFIRPLYGRNPTKKSKDFRSGRFIRSGGLTLVLVLWNMLGCNLGLPTPLIFDDSLTLCCAVVVAVSSLLHSLTASLLHFIIIGYLPTHFTIYSLPHSLTHSLTSIKHVAVSLQQGRTCFRPGGHVPHSLTHSLTPSLHLYHSCE
jgi:hypothetical protein